MKRQNQSINMKHLFSLFAFLFVLTFFPGCGGSDDEEPEVPVGCTFLFYTERVAEATDRLNVVVMTYISNPTTANCEAYRTAARTYINELRGFEDCAGIGDTQEFRNDLAQAEADLAELDCQ